MQLSPRQQRLAPGCTFNLETGGGGGGGGGVISGPANELAVSDVEERRTIRVGPIRRLSRNRKLASSVPQTGLEGMRRQEEMKCRREEEEQQVFLHPATKDLQSMSSFINHKLRSI